MFLGSSYLALDEPQKAVTTAERRARRAAIFDSRTGGCSPRPMRRPIDRRMPWQNSGRSPRSRRAIRQAGLRSGTPTTASRRIDGDVQRQAGRSARGVSCCWPMRWPKTAGLTDAFALYRSTLEQLPAMVSIHDSIARIYEQTSHADWAARERTQGVLAVIRVRHAESAVRVSRRPLPRSRSRRAQSDRSGIAVLVGAGGRRARARRRSSSSTRCPIRANAD